MAGTTIENQTFLLGVVTALGTISAAAAAFWAADAAAQSARLTQKSFEYQVGLEDTKKEPNLIISDARWDSSEKQNGFKIEFANLGQYPVFVRRFVNDVHGAQNNKDQPIELFVPAANVKGRLVETIFPMETVVTGELRFFFQYGATGLTYHRVAIPYKIETRVSDPGKGMFTQEHYILSAEQEVTENLGFERELLFKNVLNESRFRDFDWSTYSHFIK